jgi:hypothetical protein
MKTARTTNSRMPGTARKSWANYLAEAGFVLLITLVVARATMLESVRDPFEVYPSSDPSVRVPGPAASLLLDLACCIPTLLVLARRLVDREFRLVGGWSHLLLFLLAGWTAASVAWASDQFAAMIAAAQFVTAAAAIWAAVQLVDSWARLRLVAAVAFGLLMLFNAHAAIHQFLDEPAIRTDWETRKGDYFKSHGWDPDSFIARQFNLRVINGEMEGFDASPNSFAAELVLLLVITGGLMIQRASDRDGWGWIVVLAAAVPSSVETIILTRCRAAGMTLFLGVAGLVAMRAAPGWIARHARRLYVAVVALFATASTLLVIHGLRFGTLLHDSLTFRWKYWVGTWRIIRMHPWIGVGWDNFSAAYMMTRLPEAAEEIRDPHNFILKFFVELGIIGGLLLIAWMARLWWELTVRPAAVAASDSAGVAITPGPFRPSPPAAFTAERRRPTILPTLGLISAGVLIINSLASIDLTQDGWYVGMELIRRLLFAAILLLGSIVALARSLTRPEVDPRPAFWARRAILIGIGVFLIHNLIEFSLFEVGPMFLFALLVGAAMGATAHEARRGAVEANAPATPSTGRGWAGLGLAGGAAVWLSGAVFVAIPVIRAESVAQSADDDLRKGTPASLSNAADGFVLAHSILPMNSDYAYRAFRAMLFAKRPKSDIKSMLDAAVAGDPASSEYRLARAKFEAETNDPADAVRDFQSAVEMNPADVPSHVAFADTLRQYGFRARAVEQYRQALQRDDQLDAAEPKRMNSKDRVKIEMEIGELSTTRPSAKQP